MLTHLCGPENRAAYDAAVESLAKVIHEGDWALGGSNGGRDWRWDRASDKARRHAYAKAEAVLRSEELTAIVAAAVGPEPTGPAGPTTPGGPEGRGGVAS